MTGLKGNGILFSEMTPPEQDETHFNEWYFHHHMPSHVYGVPGFLSGQRYRYGKTRHYLAVYELDSVETLDDPEYRTRKYMPDAATRSMLARVDGFTRYVARETGTELRGGNSPDSALAANMLLVAFHSDKTDINARNWRESFRRSGLSADYGWCMTRRFQIINSDPKPFDLLLLHYFDVLPPELARQAGQLPAGGTNRDKSFSDTRRIHYKQFGRRYRKTDPGAANFVPRFAAET